MVTPLTVTGGERDGRPLLVADGEIDLSNVDTFTDALASVTATAGASVTVDLSAVEYLDSAAVNVLAIHADQVPRMRVIAHPSLITVLTISGVSELADVQTAAVGIDL